MMTSFGNRQNPPGRPPRPDSHETHDAGQVLTRIGRAASDMMDAAKASVPGVVLRSGLRKAKSALDRMQGR